LDANHQPLKSKPAAPGIYDQSKTVRPPRGAFSPQPKVIAKPSPSKPTAVTPAIRISSRTVQEQTPAAEYHVGMRRHDNAEPFRQLFFATPPSPISPKKR